MCMYVYIYIYIYTTRNFGETFKGRRLLFARDALRRIAGSFRRVLLGPKWQWQQYAGICRPPCDKSPMKDK